MWSSTRSLIDEMNECLKKYFPVRMTDQMDTDGKYELYKKLIWEDEGTLDVVDADTYSEPQREETGLKE